MLKSLALLLVSSILFVGCCSNYNDYFSSVNDQATLGLELMKRCQAGNQDSCAKAQESFQTIADTSATMMKK